MEDFANTLSTTSVSLFLQDNIWVIVWLQIIHIISIAAVITGALMIALRVNGRVAQTVPLVTFSGNFVRLIWVALVILAVSGVMLIVGEPVRSLVNAIFWTKMILLAIAISVTIWFQYSVRRSLADWDIAESASSSRLALFGFGTVLLWCAIAVAGRWIAYA